MGVHADILFLFAFAGGPQRYRVRRHAAHRRGITREKNGENGFAEWGDILTTTTKAYHPEQDALWEGVVERSELGAAPPTRRLQPRPTLSSARQVEVDLVMHPQTPLWLSHDISQDLQDRIEDLLMVERAFIHVDHETDHRPEHRKNV
ncbi:hypothetical protein A4X06_0g8837 [Tilletia controversa]|uniref:Cation efflux protein cytoplasmic domain-containing protein n=1 Tax=Tilletia controversa TaxID=13291 RepID=A0A8X7SSQ2_9BASI|nr:hypothetical protein A4X06_0g8837 [Tilletia controversa]